MFLHDLIPSVATFLSISRLLGHTVAAYVRQGHYWIPVALPSLKILFMALWHEH